MYQGSRKHTATLSLAGQRVTWAQLEDSGGGGRLLRRRREFLPKVVISAQLVGFRAGSPPFLEPVSLMAANHEKEKVS